MKFREAVTSANATFYLAQGENGNVYGALTYVKIPIKPDYNFYGPGETLLFSVTNKKIFKYAGKSGKPIGTYYRSNDYSTLGFSDGDTNWAMNF